MNFWTLPDPRRWEVMAYVVEILVDLIGIEPMTSSMPWKRAPSCATGPRGCNFSILVEFSGFVKPTRTNDGRKGSASFPTAKKVSLNSVRRSLDKKRPTLEGSNQVAIPRNPQPPALCVKSMLLV